MLLPIFVISPLATNSPGEPGAIKFTLMFKDRGFTSPLRFKIIRCAMAASSMAVINPPCTIVPLEWVKSLLITKLINDVPSASSNSKPLEPSISKNFGGF